MLPLSQRNLGILEIIVSGLAFGLLGVFGKAAYHKGLTATELLSFRFSMASLVLFFILLLFKPSLLKIKMEPLLKCLALGVFGYAIFSSCYFQALKGLSASLTVLLLYLYPVMVSLGALFLFKEKISFWGWIALPLTCLGMTLLVWGDMNVRAPTSLIFGVASAIFYSIYILASRAWLKNVAALSSVFYIQMGTALTLTLLSFESVERSLSVLQTAWPILLGIAVFSTLLPMLLFLSGLKKLSSSETSILSTTEPLTAIFVAGLLLGERLSVFQYLGALCVLSALILTSLPKRLLNHR